MTSLSRRSFLRIAGSGLLVPTALTGWSPIRKASAQEQIRYDGTFWLTIHASGGWDPTMICDPKGRANETEVAPVNTYFTDEILELETSWSLQSRAWKTSMKSSKTSCWLSTVSMFKPMDTNKAPEPHGAVTPIQIDPLFLLWLRLATNQPSLAFISNGGYDTTAGLVPVTRLPNANTIAELAYPDRRDPTNPEALFLPESVQEKIHAARQARLERIQGETHLPRTLNSMQVLEMVQSDNSELQSLVAAMPNELSDSDLERQIQVALYCFSAGVSVSANVSIGGFDTHNNHDVNQTPRSYK